MIDLIENDTSITFPVRVIPRSSKTEIVGEHDGMLKIKLKSPPVNGAANDELIRPLKAVRSAECDYRDRFRRSIAFEAHSNFGDRRHTDKRDFAGQNLA